MFIKDIIKNKGRTISFEVFPPKEKSAYDALSQAIKQMSTHSPDFISVTYGAGGGTSKNTVKIASNIQEQYDITALAHLTCVSSTKKEIEEIVSKLKQYNISNILALRGDIPHDCIFPTPNYYHFAYELICDIKKIGEFCIGGACYPEGHVESKNSELDIEYLKQKADAGCDFFITQFFFDNRYFYNFMDKLIKKNVAIPILAGIMPVTNAKQIKKMCLLSGASIPDSLKAIVDKYKDNPSDMQESGIEYARKQIENLNENGVDGIHIYTMNKAVIAERILQ